MKKVILAVMRGLVFAGGIKEAGAAACCCTDASISEGSKGTVAGGTDCVALGEMADQEGTRDPRDPEPQGNSEATGRPSESHQNGPANVAQSPIGQKDSR